MPKGPNNYDPNKNYERAFDRRNYVLKQMKENKFISSDIYEYSIKEKIIVSKRNNEKYKLDYKTDFILDNLNKSIKNVNNAFYIQSTINQKIQRIAEKSLLDNLLLFEKKYKNWNGSFSTLNDIQATDYLSLIHI